MFPVRFDCNPKSKRHIELHNIERVRTYLENNLGCIQKEVCNALELDRRTVAKAIKIIRSQLTK
jgi:hypothetical protein